MKIIALVVATLLATTSNVAAQSPPEWSQRGIFVFGNLSMDFEKEKVRKGGRASPLANCSSDAFYCVKSDLLSVVLPKACAKDLRVGDVWSTSGVETHVVAALDEPVGHLGTPGGLLYVLETSGNPHVALIYKRSSGVLAILADYNKGVDLSWATASGRGEYSAINASPYLNGIYSPLTTFDPFGPCFG